MSDLNRTNCMILARYLAEHAHLKDTIIFGMAHFNCVRQLENHVCKTSCCAVGCGLLAGVEDTKGELYIYDNIRDNKRKATVEDLLNPKTGGLIAGWTNYSETQFTENAQNWSWMFSGSWSLIDDTQMGAAKRIFWLLKNRELPGWFYDYWSDLDSYFQRYRGGLDLEYQTMDITEYIQPDFDKAMQAISN